MHGSGARVIPWIAWLALQGCTTANPDFVPAGTDALPALGATTAPDAADPVTGGGVDATGAHDAVDASGAVPPSPADAGPAPWARLCKGNDCGPGEICLFMEPGARTGVCLKECDTPDEPCPAPDPLVAGCTVYFNTEVGQVAVCMVFCRLGTQRYPCPGDHGYKCKGYGGWGACIADD